MSLIGFIHAPKIIFQPYSIFHRSDLFFKIVYSIRHWFLQQTELCTDSLTRLSDLVSWPGHVIPPKVCMPMRNQRSNLGCETARGLGGDTVTRWCYSNLFGRQSYAETEGLMSQSSWSEFGCRHYVLPSSICMPLKSWMGTSQETSKKNYSGPKVQRWPFVRIGRCKMGKQIPGLHNWATIWMSFPFLLCDLTMANQDLGGGTCCSTNSFFFCPTHDTAGLSIFSNDNEMVGNLKRP